MGPVDGYGDRSRRGLTLRLATLVRAGAPVVLALGSWRGDTGLRAEALVDCAGTPRDPLLFNGGLLGAGPLLQLLALDRLLRAGERPDAVVVEFWPPLLADGAWSE